MIGIFLSIVFAWLVIQLYKRARKADREERRIYAEMRAEMQAIIFQIETGRGRRDPGSGMAGDRAS